MPIRTPVRTGDQFLVREINLSVIMNALREYAPVSRATLAEITGLNKSTVSSLVNELIERHFIREVGMTSNGTGRPSVLLELNPRAGAIVSAEIGVDFILVICADFAAQVIWRRFQPIHPADGQPAVLECMLSLLDEAVATARSYCEISGTLLGLAVGVPGLVDDSSGGLLFMPSLGWENVPLKALLQDRYRDIPIFINNEANSAALGETFFGVAQGYDFVLYISAGSGLRGAMVRRGNLVTGAQGFATEFGHMTMDVGGVPCRCGNQGCWETQASVSALFRLIREAAARGEPSLLRDMAGDGLQFLTVPLVVEAAERGDAVALAALDKVGEDLGTGIASLINVLNPDIVILGGILSLAQRFLMPNILDTVHRRALQWSVQNTLLTPAQHSSDACVIGGIALVYQAMLAHPDVAARMAV